MSKNNIPKVSCLSVVDGRKAFMPWLIWNYKKQTWANKELIIIDSTPEGRREEPFGFPVRYFHTDERIISVKRNMAMEVMSGDYFTWFDDDDWQSPTKIEKLMSAMDDKTMYVGSSLTAMVNLHTKMAKFYTANKNLTLFTGTIYHKDLIDTPFSENMLTHADYYWRVKLLEKYEGGRKYYSDMLYFLLSHNQNIVNTIDNIGKDNFKISLPQMRKTLNDNAAWGDTDAQMDMICQRLKR